MKILNRNVIILASILIASFILWYFRSIVGYVLISWIFSLVCMPIMRFYKRLKTKKWAISNGLSAGLTIVTFFIFLSLIITLFVPMILSQINTIAEADFGLLGDRIQEPLDNMTQGLIDFGLLSEKQPSPFDELKNEAFDAVNESITAVFGSVLSLTSSLLIGFFSVVFMTFFFLREPRLIKKFFSAFVSNDKENKVYQAVDEIRVLLSRYFLGILGQITVITLLVSLGLTAFGIKNAFLIALFAAFANVIPYLGPLIGAAFGTIIVITSNMDLDFYNELVPIIWKVLIVFALMQIIDNFLLQPLIHSTSVKAHPLEIFIIILVGATIYGVIGMILAIPIYTVLRVIAHTFLMRFKMVRRFTKNLDDITIE